MIREIKTEKFEGLAVLVPDDALKSMLDCEIETNQSVIPYGKCLRVPDGHYHSFPNYMYIDLPDGNYSILGKATELTEEQCAEIVYIDSVPYGEITHTIFVNYLNQDFEAPSAVDSFASLMQSLECYSVNPFEAPYPLQVVVVGVNKYEEMKEEWKEAQANTGTWLILKKI